MAKFKPKETWGFVSRDDGHYFICAGRTRLTSTTSSAQVIGTAMHEDTAILMAAAPDLYNTSKALNSPDNAIHLWNKRKGGEA